MHLDGLDDQLMAMSALRYCLGRESYIVSACIAWVRGTWDEFNASTQETMTRDIIEALMARHRQYRRDWRVLAKWAFEKLPQEARDRIRCGLAWRHAPWPLEPTDTGQLFTNNDN